MHRFIVFFCWFAVRRARRAVGSLWKVRSKANAKPIRQCAKCEAAGAPPSPPRSGFVQPLVRFIFSRLGVSQNQLTKITSFRRAMQTLKERYAGDTKQVGQTLSRVEMATGVALEVLDKHFGIASSQFLPSQNTLLALFDFIFTREFSSAKDIPGKDRRRMLYWFIVGSFNGIYSSSANWKIEEDLAIIRSGKGGFPLDALLKAMKDRPPRANAINKSDVTDERFNVLRGRTGKEYLMLLDVLLHRNQAMDWAGKNIISEDAAVQ